MNYFFDFSNFVSFRLPHLITLIRDQIYGAMYNVATRLDMELEQKEDLLVRQEEEAKKNEKNKEKANRNKKEKQKKNKQEIKRKNKKKTSDFFSLSCFFLSFVQSFSSFFLLHFCFLIFLFRNSVHIFSLLLSFFYFLIFLSRNN